MLPETPARIHMVGIGGSGMSKLATLLSDWGYVVTGSDAHESPVMGVLEARGIQIASGAAGVETCSDAALVVRSAAVPDDDAEVAAARARGVPVIKYAEALGEATRLLPTVAVAGAHGKSSTAAMITKVLVDGHFRPAFVIGADVPQLDGLRRPRTASFLVVEACEYDRSFHRLAPRFAAITNVEPDHLDCYGSSKALTAAYARFASSLPTDGFLVANADCSLSRRVARAARCRLITFGRNPRADYRILSMSSGAQAVMELADRSGTYTLRLPLMGRHNAFNAACAFAVCHSLGVAAHTIRAALETFTGAARRLQTILSRPVTVIDDYAHHPTEIEAVVDAVTARHGRRSVFVFQPHQHTRLLDFFNEFVDALAGAPESVVLPVYSVRESERARRAVNHTALAAAVVSHGANCYAAASDDDALDYLKQRLPYYKAICFMGAGDVWRLAYRLRAALLPTAPEIKPRRPERVSHAG